MSMPSYQRFWIIGLILCLSSIPVATHLWIQFFPPQGALPTGVHTGDSAHHLVCMRAVRTHFHSPYATCQAEMGTQDGRYFANPLFLLYVVLGFFSHGIGISDFLFLGFANSIGGALYLWAVYCFLRRVAPQQAFYAFLLFVFGGGLGGLAYVYARGSGLYAAPGFESYFMRFASYELIEGQYIAPLLLMPRLYYTLPLAMGWAALTLFFRIEGDRQRRYIVWTGIVLLLLVASFLNLRLGPMFLLVLLLYMAIGSTHPIRNRLRHFVMLSAPVLLGMLFALGVLHQHPSYIKNVSDVAQGMMKVIPFLTAVFFAGCLAVLGIFRLLPNLSGRTRLLLFGLLGYAIAYVLLILGYQAYYGNWWQGGDAAAAVAMSDWALLGIVPGLFVGYILRAKLTKKLSPCGWIVVWLLLFFSLATGAFGHGTFLRFSPERFMVFLGIPLSIIAAYGLASLPAWGRRLALACVLISGGVSIVVSTLFFQGPLGFSGGRGPFSYLHYELMTDADAQLLESLPSGTVLTPPWSPIAFGEVVAQRDGMQVVGGPGAMNLGDQDFATLQEQVNRFFAPNTDAKFRRDFLTTWCVDYIYCPDTCPVSEEFRNMLMHMPELYLRVSVEKGCIFAVSSLRPGVEDKT